MTTLSDPTLGLLVQIAADSCTRDELATLLLRADLMQEHYLGYEPGGSSKHGLVRQRLRGAREVALQGEREAHRSLLTFTRTLVEQIVPDPEDPPGWFADLRESMLGDGYELTWDRTAEQFGFGRPTITVTYQILPTDSGPVPLAAEISALEQELDSRSYGVALNHYRQAINAFGQHDYEAANSQLRATLEDLVVQLAVSHTGFVKPPNQGGGRQAIDRLKATSNLDARNGGDMLVGLWGMSHSDGPHPGTSNADEARFRVQVITAMARLLLHRFP